MAYCWGETPRYAYVISAFTKSPQGVVENSNIALVALVPPPRFDFPQAEMRAIQPAVQFMIWTHIPFGNSTRKITMANWQIRDSDNAT